MELLAPFHFEVLLSTFGVALLPPQLSGGDAFPPPPFGWCCFFHFILRVLMLPSSPFCGWCCLRPSLLSVVPPALWVPSFCGAFLFVGGAAWFPPPFGWCCFPNLPSGGASFSASLVVLPSPLPFGWCCLACSSSSSSSFGWCCRSPFFGMK